MKASFDIVICGGGISGLLATACFGLKGYNVLCVEPSKKKANLPNDFRSTALLQKSVAVLEQYNIWNDLLPYATPLKTMRIVNVSEDKSSSNNFDFSSSDISELPFGWNVSNSEIKKFLQRKIENIPNAEILFGNSIKDIFTRSSGARVTLIDDRIVNTNFIIAADGKNSFVRNFFKIKCRQKDFNQIGLAFTVEHSKSHKNISTEIYMSGGPFTLVPLEDKNGKYRSAVVWMDVKTKVEALLQMDKETFQKAVNKRSCEIMGKLTVTSEVSSWPIVSQLSKSFYAQRTALLAEAAHVFPPIGAQGLNTSIGDISTLLNLAKEFELGSDEMLVKYNRIRKRNIEIKLAGINTLNIFSIADTHWMNGVRQNTLKLLHGIKPIRTKLMEYAMTSF